MKVKNKVYTNQGNKEVLKHVPEDAFKVLDLGCGVGDNARILSDERRTVDGVTISPDEAKIASEYCENVYVHDLESGLPEGIKSKSYECVLCSHLIEHLRDPNIMLEEVYSVMKNGARLIVALPNVVHYKNRFRILLGKFEYEESGIMDNTHYKFYTYKTAQRTLKHVGPKKIKSYVTGGFPLSRILPDTIEVWIDRLSCYVFPGLFGRQIILVYEKQV